MKKITHVAWLNGGQIGVVKTEIPFKGECFYIKKLDYSLGPKPSAIQVAHWGHCLTTIIGQAIIDEYGSPFEIEYL